MKEPKATTGGKEDVSTFFKRELRGATFLTLEHILHMVFIIAVAGFVAWGASLALSMLTGASTTTSAETFTTPILGSALDQLASVTAIMVVAALITLSPWLIILDRRTRAEWLKRPGYINRLGYKLPLYTALGVVALIKLVIFIGLLWIVLYSLATLGVNESYVGSLYRDQFLPGLIALIVFGATGWYLMLLAKGRDFGRRFNLILAAVGILLAAALFTSATINLQNNTVTPQPAPLEDYLRDYDLQQYESGNLEDLFKY